ncbi:hypothetical protein C3L33_12163, partial [Rhododendron williamsianum]
HVRLHRTSSTTSTLTTAAASPIRTPSARAVRARPNPHPEAHLHRRHPNPSPTQTKTPPPIHANSLPDSRVDPAAVAETLQISPDHARLVLDTLAAVLCSDRDDVESLVRSNSRRFMPSQSDDETHQLSYLQKHLANIISLLADSVEGESEEYLVLTMEKFKHLEFLIYFGEKGSERISLTQAAPFFANSDPDMPAAPVPATEVHDWLLQNITSALEHISERFSAKENGPPSASDQDVGNCHDSVIYILAPLRYATIYGCSDATIVLGAVGKAVRVEHCERVHVIAAAKRICIANCRECVFFLGVNQRPLIVGDNHKLQVCECHCSLFCTALLLIPMVATPSNISMPQYLGRMKLIDFLLFIFMLYVEYWLLEFVFTLLAHFEQVAPYNTFYSHLEEHMNQVGIQATINRWDDPVALGVVDPHDSLSHPAGVSDVQAESATRLDPDQFTTFLIPNWFEGESSGSTEGNPFHYQMLIWHLSIETYHNNLGEMKQILRETQLEDSKKRELSSALHVYFKDWLYGKYFYSRFLLCSNCLCCV